MAPPNHIMDLMRATVEKSATMKGFDPLCRPSLAVYGCGHARLMPAACNSRFGPHRDHDDTAAPTGACSHYACIECRFANFLGRKEELDRQLSADEDPEDDWVLVTKVSPQDLEIQAREVRIDLGQEQEARDREVARGVTQIDLEATKGNILWE